MRKFLVPQARRPSAAREAQAALHLLQDGEARLPQTVQLRIMAISTRSGAVQIYGGPHVQAPRHGHCHPGALVARPGPPPGPAGGQRPPCLEIVHHDGCVHLEEALSFQPPSRQGFDSGRGLPSLVRITVDFLVAAGDLAALGTESANVFFLAGTCPDAARGQTLHPEEVL